MKSSPMKYLYFPGCSLKGTGKAYEESLLAVFRTLGVELKEIDGAPSAGDVLRVQDPGVRDAAVRLVSRVREHLDGTQVPRQPGLTHPEVRSTSPKAGTSGRARAHLRLNRWSLRRHVLVRWEETGRHYSSNETVEAPDVAT